MNYSIVLNKGFRMDSNNTFVTLGMSKPEVHAALNMQPSFLLDTMEYYENFRVDYDSNDIAVAFEFFSNSNLYIKSEKFFTLEKRNLFTIPFEEMNTILEGLDPQVRISNSGVISLEYGIGTYLEDSDDIVCETIIIFQKGYYDSLGW